MKRQKNKTILIFLCMITIIFSFFSVSSAAEEQYEKLNIKMAVNGTEQGVDALSARKFAEMVKEASNGNINIRVYANAQLSGGNMAKSIELLSQGNSYELALISGNVVSYLDEKFGASGLPFVYENYDAVNKILDSTGGEWLTKMMDSNGLVFLGALHNGLKQITNNVREIKTPEDLNGLKIRIPGGEAYMMFFRECGADPVAMTWSEVFTALQQGTIDGHENSYQTIDSASINEVQKYLTECNWNYGAYYIIANKERWNEFSDPVKNLMREKSREAALWGREFLENAEKGIKQKFIEEGMIITELNTEELQAFRDVSKPIINYFAEKFGEEALNAWGVKVKE